MLFLVKVLFLSAVVAAQFRPEEAEFLEKYKRRGVLHDAHKLSEKQLFEYINATREFWVPKKDIPPLDVRKRKVMDKKFKKKAPSADKPVFIGRRGESSTSLPQSFDARQQWSYCQTLTMIRDQAACGGCWAFAAAEAISDRTCIATQGEFNAPLSAMDVLSCCTDCGYGCEGGYPIDAWNYWVNEGLVTGGNYDSQVGCQPSSLEPCSETGWPTCPSAGYTAPTCYDYCTNSQYTKNYTSSKHYGKSAYYVSSSVSAIQTEIMRNGPVEAAFDVYMDFYMYQSGIYVHNGGALEGGHAVKIIGWGSQNGTPYWIVANSWGSNWGENGFFRIIRGANECGIEDAIVAGIVNY